ncbi:MAG: DUF6036 family nucleotidyltransferase [Mycobacteriales bacterium]
MRRAELAHVLRAACRIAGDGNILVLGSQAILGSHSEHELPDAAWMSMEVDVAFLHEDPATPKWAAVDGAIGELSQFHQTFSYYAQGVEVTTASLPDGWRDRLVAFQPEDAEPARAVCLDKHDLVIAKLVAHREKDLTFAGALLDAGLLDTSILLARVAALSCVPPPTRRRVQQWLTAASKARG